MRVARAHNWVGRMDMTATRKVALKAALMVAWRVGRWGWWGWRWVELKASMVAHWVACGGRGREDVTRVYWHGTSVGLYLEC